MSFNVAMLKAMREEGLDFDAAIRVLEAGERKADPTNAERQARHRARKSNAVTVTPAAPNDNISNPPEENLSSSDDSQKFGIEQAFDHYNETAAKAGLRKAASLTAERRKGIRERLKAHGVDGFRRACAAAAASPFCRGENDRGWKADLDFLLQRKSFLRLIEGFYGGTDAGQPRCQLTAADYEDRAKNFRAIGNEDEARRMLQLAEQMRASIARDDTRKFPTGPPASIGETAARIVGQLGQQH